MKSHLIVALLLCSAGCLAQSAVVVELSKTDADQAKQLYEAKQAADKAWEDAYAKIIGKYQGFAGGAEFSKDFRFIVPKYFGTTSFSIASSTVCGTCGCNWVVPNGVVGSGAGSFVPAVGTVEMQ